MVILQYHPNIYNFHLSKDCSEPILSQMEYYSFPWFNEYEKTFLELTNFNECEMYQQPLVNVYICSVKDITNCVNEIKCNQNPLLITEGIYEDNVSNLIILLNDKKEEVQAEDDDTNQQSDEGEETKGNSKGNNSKSIFDTHLLKSYQHCFPAE